LREGIIMDKKEQFSAGASVIYALHGKCSVLGTETKQMDGKSVSFYRLELKKSNLSRSQKTEPAIWVPVSNAKDRGMREPMNKEQAAEAMSLLNSREYFFKLTDMWNVLQPKFEETIRAEGGLGLAKVVSFLFVLKKKSIVASPEVLKLSENVEKLLFRELAEALNEPIKELEEKVYKGFRNKLKPDH
jgi:RNA polymerase-interacting CarD/CdnL/TRCF family regulator